MTIHWLPLFFGLLLGLTPPKRLLTSECRYLRFDALWARIMNPLKTHQRRRRWWKLPLVWIDPVRGFLTGYLLRQAFEAAPHASGIANLFPFIATLFALGATLWVQTSGREDHGETISPTAFLGGMMIATMPLVVACSAIAMGASTAVVMSRFAAGYIVAAITTACIGYLILGKNLWLPASVLLVASPLLVSWLKRTSLVMPVRC